MEGASHPDSAGAEPAPEPAPARLVETLISVVVFFGDHAYKAKKPVRLDYLDLSTLAARERMCRREVELNRRLAPDVYLGVADVHGPDGAVCEHLVVMRRMPDDRRLSTLVVEGDAEEADGILRDLARLLAAFHSRAERGPHVDAQARADAVEGRWADNFTTMRDFAGSVFAAGDLDRAARLATTFVRGRDALFDARVAAGHVCDGHGDLQCADVFCLDDGPRVLDCVEFDDTFRYGDVAEDVAFLVMDLERLAGPEVAGRFLGDYEEFAGDVFPPVLMHLYVAYRAQVRAKVAALRWGQGAATDSRDEARELLDLCLAHLERTRVRLVLVGGLPGTGKTTLARGLSAALGCTLVRTDAVRDRLAPVTGDEPDAYLEGAFAPATTEAVYAAVSEQAATALAHGESCILDASWADSGRRARAREVAEAGGAELVEIRCVVDAATAAGRVAARAQAGTDASRATPAIAEHMRPDFAPWPEAAAVDTARAPAEVLAAALALPGVGTRTPR